MERQVGFAPPAYSAYLIILYLIRLIGAPRAWTPRARAFAYARACATALWLRVGETPKVAYLACANKI